VEIAKEMIGSAKEFLQPGMELPMDFFEGKPVNVVLPQIVEVRIETTAPSKKSIRNQMFCRAPGPEGRAVLDCRLAGRQGAHAWFTPRVRLRLSFIKTSYIRNINDLAASLLHGIPIRFLA
jgi:hypothetical protein